MDLDDAGRRFRFLIHDRDAKTRSRRQDGYKAHAVVEPDTEIITDTTLTPAAGPTNSDARLRRENAELRRANEILMAASAFSPRKSTRQGNDIERGRGVA